MCNNLLKHCSSPERDAGVGESGCQECECLYEIEKCGVIQHISFLKVRIRVFAHQMFNAVQL